MVQMTEVQLDQRRKRNAAYPQFIAEHVPYLQPIAFAHCGMSSWRIRSPPS
jgi:hypothetical protein